MNGTDMDSEGFFHGAYKEIEKNWNPIKNNFISGGRERARIFN
jgi:hypothetical protein